ncbi:MAG: hypothetical protein GY711_25110 [bacterium]|nr:hypothetical protein [bacterium]
MPASSDGVFCLVGGHPDDLGRYEGDVFNSGATGTGSLAIDVNSIPVAGGPDPAGPFTRALLSGETWNFQCWYRDDLPPGGVPRNNFTDAISILFQ